MLDRPPEQIESVAIAWLPTGQERQDDGERLRPLDRLDVAVGGDLFERTERHFDYSRLRNVHRSAMERTGNIM